MVRDAVNKMDRLGVLSLLRRHAGRCCDAHEGAMTASTISFVEATPNCFLRSQLDGHLTGSAWIVDPTQTKVLLTHHNKLNKWVQLGGHADGDPDLWNVAQREAREESGLTRWRMRTTEIFDVDLHIIPTINGVAQHYHYDLRFLFEADPSEPLVLSSESKDLAWVPLHQVENLSSEGSIARMVRKTLSLA